jgi:hypothetical protein
VVVFRTTLAETPAPANGHEGLRDGRELDRPPRTGSVTPATGHVAAPRRPSRGQGALSPSEDAGWAKGVLDADAEVRGTPSVVLVGAFAP